MICQKFFGRLALGAMLLLAGCFTPTRPPADYLLSPARFTLARPLFVSVSDRRPPVQFERRPNGYWRHAPEPDDKRQTALRLANDVRRALLLKGMAETVIVLFPDDSPPRDAWILEILLHSWYGRVPDRSAAVQPSESVLRFVAPSLSTYAEGQCHIDTELRGPGSRSFSCGRSEGNAVLKDDSQNTEEDAARIASAMAADQATAHMLRQLEKRLGSLPHHVLHP